MELNRRLLPQDLEGSILPGEVRLFRFAFRSESAGIFSEASAPALFVAKNVCPLLALALAVLAVGSPRVDLGTKAAIGNFTA